MSRFKNLLHHFTHQHSQGEASTFWVGCGAIRREVFGALGGFYGGYGRPAVADIELGMRLKEAGQRILLDPAIQVTHLKYWTLASLFKSDIFDRAVPWSRLILRQGRLPVTLNIEFSRPSRAWRTFSSSAITSTASKNALIAGTINLPSRYI